MFGEAAFVPKLESDNWHNPDHQTICDWMIKYRTMDTNDCRCFNPFAFCWYTGKNMFLRKATTVMTVVDGPGDIIRQKFYFKPKYYTVYMLLK